MTKDVIEYPIELVQVSSDSFERVRKKEWYFALPDRIETVKQT
jgi:hypothetical protein